MESPLLHRVQAITEQLASLRQELGHPAADPQTGLAVPKLSPEEVRGLKLEVDHMRMFLWAYMDSWSILGDDTQQRLQRMRINTATDMLRQLQDDFSRVGVPASAEANLLAQQLHALTPMMPT